MQSLFASFTQRLSHDVVQQYESSSHTVVAHSSQVALSFLPVVPGECEHVLAPLLLLVLLVLPPLLLLDEEEEELLELELLLDEEEELLPPPGASAFSNAPFGVPQPVGPS